MLSFFSSALLLVAQVVLFPVFLTATILNIHLTLGFGLSNGSMLAFRHKFFDKLELVFMEPAGQNKPKSSSIRCETNIDGLTAYAIPKRKDESSFRAVIKNDAKKMAIQKLKEFMIQNREERALTLEQVKSFFVSLDRECQTNLYENLFMNPLQFPTFLRADKEIWYSLSDLLGDLIIDEGDEAALISTFYADIPHDGQGGTFGRGIATDSYFASMLQDASVDKIMLWNIHKYGNLDIKPINAKLIGNRLGDWVWLLSKETRYFLYMALMEMENLRKVNDSDTLEIVLRKCFYGFLQAADCEIIHRISLPFRNYLGAVNSLQIDDPDSEFGKFLLGSYPPTMAGVGRFLSDFRKYEENPRSIVFKKFGDFVQSSEYLDMQKVTNRRFIQKLYQMGRLRGSIMHPDKFNIRECSSVIQYLFTENKPGDFFYSIGIDIAY